MAVTTNNAKLPNDPVMLLAMVIDKIRSGALRVGMFDIFTRPQDCGNKMELVMTLEPFRLYDSRANDPIAFVTGDIPGDSVTENRTTQLSVGDIINDIREFREWRETRDRDKRDASYARSAATGRAPVETMNELTAAFKAGSISMETFRKRVLQFNGAGQMTREEAQIARAMIDPRPSFEDMEAAADDWIASDSKDPNDIGKPAGRKRKAAEPETPAKPPGRELIFDE